jgi:hypothetical protein
MTTLREPVRRLRLPAPDRKLSPRTGFVRDHWIAVADHLLEALVPWFSPARARIDLPGRTGKSGATCDGLEGFARSFLLAAFRIAATGGIGCDELITRYADGLAAGADPDGPESWARLAPGSQQMVEAAAISIALHESRPWFWDRLDVLVQEKVADWIGGFVGSTTYENNWRLFQVVGEQFLASVGAPYSQDDIDAALDRIEDWYDGDGWYRDGDDQSFDYYGGWVMHVYPALWSRMATATPGADPAARLASYTERLHTFLADAVHLIGTDGAPVHHGRSLCYRTATAAPYWAGAMLDATPLSPGTTRRVCSGILRHFIEHGVPNKQGLLDLGWYHRFLGTTHHYSGPGSPYWASKGFLGLLLPADHPVWTEREAPTPIDQSDQTQAMPAPGFLLHATHDDGIVRLLNHGSDHAGTDTGPQPEPPADPHYDRLAYSSRTGPEISRRPAARRLDNSVLLTGPDGSSSHRGRIRRVAVGGHYAASWFRADLPNVAGGPWRVESASVVNGAWEIRCQLVDGPQGAGVHHGGYAVACQRIPETAVTASGARPWASATRADGLASVVVGLHGFDQAAIARDVDTNAFGPHSATPYLIRDIHPGTPLVLVSAVILSGDSVWPEAVADTIEVEVDGDRVALRFADGTSAVVRLGTSTAGGARFVLRAPGRNEEVVVGG